MMVRRDSPLAQLAAAYEARLAGVRVRQGRERGAVVGYVGTDVPLEVLDAAGVRAVRVCGDPVAADTDADSGTGNDPPTGTGTHTGTGRATGTAANVAIAEGAIDGMARSQLARLVGGTYAGLDHLLVSHDTEGSARLFHYASECRHLGIGDVPPVTMVDVLHRPVESSTRYSTHVVADVRRLAGRLGDGPVTDEALVAAMARASERRRLVEKVTALRAGSAVRLRGSEALAVFGAAAILDAGEHAALLRDLVAPAADLPTHEGLRVFLTGSAHDHPRFYEAIEARGAVIVGEDHDWGDAWFDDWSSHGSGDESGNRPDPGASRKVELAVDNLTDDENGRADESLVALDRALALRYQFGAPRSGRHPTAARARYTAARAVKAGAEVVLAVLRRGDGGPSWDIPAQRAALARAGIPLVEVSLGGYELGHVEAAAREAVEVLGLGTSPAPAPGGGSGDASSRLGARSRNQSATAAADGPRATRPQGLEASAVATTYQREWFAAMREQVAGGVPLAVANADAPHEVLRAMGIPYVVNQWWASVCAAKQLGSRYLGVLRDLGYPDDVEAYSAMALGSALDPDPVEEPWGGLPPVDLLVAEVTTDATAKIFEAWAEAEGAQLALLESTVAPLRPRRWFEGIHDGWEEIIGTRRLDLLVEEIRALIARVGELTGRRMDEDELDRAMALANEQAEWNARTRDLIARTSPAPIGVADAIPATMIPQWHRGSEWGRDAARRLHDEVAALVEAGQGVVEDERARLMWIGRGLWFDMGFYRRVQERHGAVFVWSMYLAIAADAYLRRGADPLRTLAGRFCGFADLYNTPPWSSEWYAKEALHNRIDGVVHLTTDAVRGTHFVTRAIEAVGVPVLEISGSNVDARAWDREAAAEAIDEFVDRRVLDRAERRRATTYDIY